MPSHLRNAALLPILCLAALPTLSTASCAPQEPQATQDPAPTAVPQTESEPSRFIRFRETGEDSGMLETAITSYRDAEGRQVDLISAIHIGDGAHYEALNQEFTAYDSVLYELVAEPEDRPDPEADRAGGLSIVQRLMARGFELEFQLDGIDYWADNFVHADLTPEKFQALQEERGESIITLLFRAMQVEMTRMRERDAEGGEAGKSQDMDLVGAFRAGYGRHRLRMAFAAQIEGIERVAAGFSDEDGGSVLVEGRNERAMEVLGERLAAGENKLAIYYGGAHMPDFEKRLQDLGFAKQDERWLVAWDVTKRKDPRPAGK